MTMRERIAARLWRRFGPPGAWEAATDSDIKRAYLKAADTVLVELQTPTDKMASVMETEAAGMGCDLCSEECKQLFTAAIFTAKEEK